jgi:hypothetical protein
MPITIPNYNRKTDRLQFGTLIGIPRNPHLYFRNRKTARLEHQPVFIRSHGPQTPFWER